MEFFKLKKIIILLIITISFASCRIIDRKVEYTTEDNINNQLAKSAIIETTISTSPNAKFKYMFPIKVYENFFEPFTLNFQIKFIANNIEKVKFKNCSIIIDGKEQDLLSYNDTSVRLSQYNNKTKIESSGNEENATTLFIKENLLIVKKSDDITIKNYWIHFHNLPINYKKDLTLKIKYSITIELTDNILLEFDDIISFDRTIQEMEMYSFIWNMNPNDKWKDITYKEWLEKL